jgi:Icc-related predicted phosphoesterase
MKICCISDTHELHSVLEIPVSDLLIHAGDITNGGDEQAILAFDRWCGSLLRDNIVRKIVTIAGNHDFLFETDPERARSCLRSSTYLEDSGIEWEGFRIWGTPWQPWFFDWAFNLKTEEELGRKFGKIPSGTDILISHGPPKNILDSTVRGEKVGSTALRSRIWEVGPRLVVFGHIHEGYGFQEEAGTILVNASICDIRYRPVNEPVIIEL